MAFQIQHGGQKISWFKDRLAEDCLVFKPPFQRNPVWLDKHKAYLVDTVLRRLPVPEVYIQTETDESGKTVYSVVDGQQRIRALLAFARGEVALMEQYSPSRDEQTWDDLSAIEKKAFWDYSLVVREIIGATEADLRDLFQRLNQNTVTLNAQEIRNARYKGEFISIVSELADQPYWAEQKIVTPNEIRRMLDIEYMAELLVGLMHGPQNKKQSIDGMFETYDAGLPNKQQLLAKFEETRALAERLVPNMSSTRWRGKSDYYSLFLAVGSLNGKGTLRSAKQTVARKALERFGEAVTARLAKDASLAGAANTRAYASAVEKAASDKDRRETRHRILTRLMQPFFKSNSA